MKLSVPTSWDNSLVEKLKELNAETKNIHELYGTMRASVLGGGRPSAILPDVSFAQVKEHIDFVHSRGFSFNYLVNAPCHGGKEFEPKFRDKMFEYLDWVNNLNVDIVTLSNPYLVELVRKEYPSLKIKISSFAYVNSVNIAGYYDQLGADRITLGIGLTRRLGKLRKIRESTRADLEVIVNANCIFDCPLTGYHSRLNGHESLEQEDGKPPLFVDYPVFKCFQKRLLSPEEMIKSCWIRPEDIRIYEEIGIEHFKLAGRTFPNEWILRCAEAYSHRKHGGNLLDLLVMSSIPFLASLTGDKTRLSSIFYVANQALDGFLDFFKDHDCHGDCEACGYCPGVAKQALQVVGDVDAFKTKLEEVLSKIVSRELTKTDVYAKLCKLPETPIYTRFR